MYASTSAVSGAERDQKMASDLLELMLEAIEPLCRCWEPNPGPMKGQ